MSGPPNTAADTTHTDPSKVRWGAGAPGGVGRLLLLVRKLIDYGRDLADSLRPGAPEGYIRHVTGSFRTGDIALILAHITRGLLRAAALEQRLVTRASTFGKGSTPTSAASPHKPPAVRPKTRRTSKAELFLSRLPTQEEIMAEVRRRPIGAVIADICRDLGITPSHPLWQELSVAIMHNGGSYGGVIVNYFRRCLAWTDDEPPIRHLKWPAEVPLSTACGTGPP